jgi:hypothetical protein
MKTPGGRDALYSGHVDEDGKPHGYGERIVTTKDLLEGQVHTGMWEHGVFQGLGKVVTPNGEIWTGEFVNVQLDGVGLCEWPNGRKYAGQFKGHTKHGFGTFTFSDGRVIFGRWAEEKQHGISLLVNVDGSKEAVTFEDGIVVSRRSSLTNIFLDAELSMILRFRGGAAA